MFAIRRRWPVLTFAGAVLLYLVNNYQIAGLEHLRLRKLEYPRQAPSGQTTNAWGASDPPLGIDLTQFGIQTTPATDAWTNLLSNDPSAPARAPASPAWSELLSIGEKLALWEDQLSQPVNNSPGLQNLPLSSANPIPPPPGMALSKSVSANSRPAELLPPSVAKPTGSLPGASPLAPNTLTPNSFEPVAQEADRRPAAAMTSLTPLSAPAFPSSPTLGSTLPGNATLGHTTSGRQSTPSIRIASFAIPGLGTALLNKPTLVPLLIAILRQYEVVALQGIESNRDDILPLIIDKLNQSGRRYDYLIGPRVGRAAPFRQFAYIFETDRVETDRYQLYSVDDPEDLLYYEPLVAWFRCKGLPAQQAFTFSLVNVSLHPDLARAERNVLPALIQAVEKDGREEDDWILLGDFAGGNALLTALDRSSVRFAISDIPTDVTGTQMLDTLFFSPRATSEFTGRAGAFDFLRKHNLSMEQALELSPHMPVWAEFSCLEGAEPGRIAPISASFQ